MYRISAGLLSLCWVVFIPLTFTACPSALSDGKCIISCISVHYFISPGLFSPFGGQAALHCPCGAPKLICTQGAADVGGRGDSPITWEWGQGAAWLCGQAGCSSSRSPPKSLLLEVHRRVFWDLSGVSIQWKVLRAFSGREKGQAGGRAASNVD